MNFFDSECTRFLMNHYWDQEEPRLLVCEAKRVPPASNNSGQTATYNRQTSCGASSQQPLTVCILFLRIFLALHNLYLTMCFVMGCVIV